MSCEKQTQALALLLEPRCAPAEAWQNAQGRRLPAWAEYPSFCTQLGCNVSYIILIFETGRVSHAALAVLELTIQNRLASKWLSSSY